MPVAWCSPTPRNAIATPPSAALSSDATVFTAGSLLSRKKRISGMPASRADRRVWRIARTHDAPSSSAAAASAPYDHAKPVSPPPDEPTIR
ncbi:MAG TPA: hypothetical protein VFL60_06915 [Gaiellaceae bacterium]|nr:hypothetical protein [Gaiellaceae bacterium]